MADKIALRRIGLGFLTITTSVMLMAALVVESHVDADKGSQFGAWLTTASAAAASVR